MTERYGEIHDTPFDDVLDYFCRILPEVFQPTCKSLVQTYGQTIVEMLGRNFERFHNKLTICFLEDHATPDVVCRAIKQCVGDPEVQCSLFPPSDNYKP